LHFSGTGASYQTAILAIQAIKKRKPSQQGIEGRWEINLREFDAVAFLTAFDRASEPRSETRLSTAVLEHRFHP
jgi:hypothetical protein